MTDHREAKAEAKAAKARAKAVRPWFKKKRFVLPLGFVVLMVIIAAAGGGGSDTTDTDLSANDRAAESASAQNEESGVRTLSDNDAHKPEDDVEILSCAKDQYLGHKAQIRVTNHSSKASDYSIEMAFESADGSEQFGTGHAFISGLEPGQSKTDDVVSLESNAGSAPATCKLTEVNRHEAF